ncbi:cytochrome P450 [Nocardia panacis]|uniref:Cytochrome P450 n=1 Tax=Nocardia panacis TaxID=2340916 RepID=A0A3A4KL15_9NOCA|nr:cytochrome P450 [Nocardia panacis]RJO69959.1 cytochrome P450 [Nocardia panacis]
MVDEIEALGPEFFADPHGHYRRWREQGPVHRVRLPRGTPRWVILGYAQARAALTDSRLRKDIDGMIAATRQQNPHTAFNPESLNLGPHPLNSDPPDHTRLRRLIGPAFTPRSAEAMRPRIQQITDELLDSLADHETVDLIAAFAMPLPVMVICELLGVPYTDRPRFRAWSQLLVTSTGTAEQRHAASREMSAYLTDLIEAKKSAPGADLLSDLVRAHTASHLTADELLATAYLLLIAGHETTVNLISSGVNTLLHHPDLRRTLQQDPTRIPSAIEEFLRLDGPVDFTTPRYTAAPLPVGPIEIPEGELVSISLAAANRDPAHYPPPHTITLPTPTPHLAFGHGIHHCPGAPLARLEAEIALTSLLHRYPTLAPAAPTPTHHYSLVIQGLTTLPIHPTTPYRPGTDCHTVSPWAVDQTPNE